MLLRVMHAKESVCYEGDIQRCFNDIVIVWAKTISYRFILVQRENFHKP